MAKMIPSQYDPATPSAAEKRIFHIFENDPGTSQWIVFHSVGLAKRVSGPYGEIDFVVLIPSGSVVCLEIKGGRISCRDGIWQTIDRFGNVNEYKRSPFLQAREGMFTLLRAVRQKFGEGSDPSKCLFVSAVIFTDVDSPPSTPEFEQWESVGRDRLRSPISRIIGNIVETQKKKLSGWRPPTAPETAIRDIRQFLRPDFERVILRSAVVNDSETAIVSLTTDQYHVLDMISNNPRCLIEGAAGTGKTVLAFEYARRQAQAGRRVLMLCFNRLLGDWLHASAGKVGQPELHAGSYFKFLRELVLASTYKEEFERSSQDAKSDQVFSELLPFFAQLSAQELNAQFDVLVVDEAQDLLNGQALEVFGTLLKGGNAGGNWYLFADFTRQCIFGGTSRDVHLQTLKDACPYFTQTQIQTNCRNTRRIGEETALLSGFTALPYKLGQIDGLPVDYRYWKNSEDQTEKLSEVVRLLLNEGISPRDIVLLSPRSFSDSVASRMRCSSPKHGSITAVEIRKGSHPFTIESQLPFATIQSFKGMESPVIILCDLDQVDDDAPQALLYTGMSRARSLLVMMIHERARDAVGRSFVRKLHLEWKS